MGNSHIRRRTKRFQTPVLTDSLVQAVTSLGGFFAVCAAMYALLGVSVLAAFALAPIGAGFLVRIFIIQHDCGHSSFFRSQRANRLLGLACSLLTLTPYAAWRRQHAGHHSVWNDLDRRNSGADIYSACLTVKEYQALTLRQRWWFRTTRHPVVANVLLPPLVFLVLYRVPFDTPKTWRRERRSIYLHNAALLAGYGGLVPFLGIEAVLTVQLPIASLGAIAGVWLFSVQHRAQTTVWVRHEDWDPVVASLRGSTLLRLPAPLQWFTGNIGYHHVHHLNPHIPNYRLQACHDALSELHHVPTLTLGDGLRATRFVLWDEDRGRMTTLRDLECQAAA